MEEPDNTGDEVGWLAMKTMNKCTAMEEKLADMLLDPEAAPAKVKTHVAECESCHKELEELRATMAPDGCVDAPEPSPYFMTRLMHGCARNAKLHG